MSKKNFGFIKVSAAIPVSDVGNTDFNSREMIKLIKESAGKGASVVVFPELSITSYTCQDLFQNQKILSGSLSSLQKIANETKSLSILSIVGLPVINNNRLFNCAAVINQGKILGIIPKSYLPSYREFYEPRWFCGSESVYNDTVCIGGISIPFGNDLLFKEKSNNNLIVGIEICEDLWMPIPPSSFMALSGAVLLCNLSASNASAGKSEYRKDLVKNQSARCIAGYIYCSCGMGESTTDVVFDADAVIAENGALLSNSERFLRKNQIIYADIDIERVVSERIKQNNKSEVRKYRIVEFCMAEKKIELERNFSRYPFVPEDKFNLDARCEEIFNIQAAGLAKRLESIKSVKAVIGLSGGLDSTLALLVTIKAYEMLGKSKKNIIGVTMPGFGTSNRTYQNALGLCRELEIELIQKDIKDISNLILDKIEHERLKHDVVYENIQARARTYILMTLANKYNAIVIGTGDMSEIALGFATYNADHISMYNVNSSVPKTLVKFLIEWVSGHELKGNAGKILKNISAQPISPELIPAKDGEIVQKTEEKIGPYELHDFFLYYFIRFGFTFDKLLFMACRSFHGKYDNKTISKYLKLFFKRFFSNQWKRDCVPGGAKVGSIDLSPRGSWRMSAEINPDIFDK